MRYLPFILLFISTVGYTQSGKNQKSEIIKLQLNSQPEKRLPFDRFVVVDNRFDTSKLGYTVVSKKYKKIQTENSLASDLSTALNSASSKSFSMNTRSALWIFIRHYWIQETDQAEAMSNKVDDIQNSNTLFTCKVTFECFLEKDSSYFPVLRYDSSLSRMGYDNESMESIASESIHGFLNKLEKINWSSGKKEMSWLETVSFTRRFRNMVSEPISGTSGVYRTFSDFQKGIIDIVQFEVKSHMTDELYIVKDGKRELLKDFWGYTDGKKLFINTGLNFYELERQGNTYEIWGNKSLIRHAPAYQPRSETLLGVVISGAASSNREVKLKGKPFQLNMETGELY